MLFILSGYSAISGNILEDPSQIPDISVISDEQIQELLHEASVRLNDKDSFLVRTHHLRVMDVRCLSYAHESDGFFLFQADIQYRYNF